MSGDNMIYSIHKKCKLSILLDDKGIFGIDMIEVDAPSGHIHWDNFFDAHRAVSLEFYQYWMYTTVSKSQGSFNLQTTVWGPMDPAALSTRSQKIKLV